MMAFPTVPITVANDILKLIAKFCPISRTEIVDDIEIGSEEDEGHRIYKFVGLADLEDIEKCIPPRFVQHYSTREVALYEKADPDNTAIFWHEGVLVVMISSTDEQHEGVMNHYTDAALLLSQIRNTKLTSRIWCDLKREQYEAEKIKRDELIEVAKRNLQPLRGDAELTRSALRNFEKGEYDQIDPEMFYGIALYLVDPTLVEITEDMGEETEGDLETETEEDEEEAIFGDKIEQVEKCFLKYFKNGDCDLIDGIEFFGIALYLKNPALVEIIEDQHEKCEDAE